MSSRYFRSQCVSQRARFEFQMQSRGCARFTFVFLHIIYLLSFILLSSAPGVKCLAMHMRPILFCFEEVVLSFIKKPVEGIVRKIFNVCFCININYHHQCHNERQLTTCIYRLHTSHLPRYRQST